MEVKVAFLLDATASMGPWIRAAKNKILEMMDDIKADNPEVNVQIALVAYRDYGDRHRYHVQDFTTAERIQDVLNTVHAHGGADEAEDVAGGLVAATDLSWNDAGVSMIVHIADAPAHGNRFHDAHVSDRFPDGDPDGWDLEGLVSSLAEDNIDYTFVKITSTTDRMIDVFQSAYADDSKFRVIDLRDQDEPIAAEMLSRGVSRAVTMSIAQSTSSQEM